MQVKYILERIVRGIRYDRLLEFHPMKSNLGVVISKPPRGYRAWVDGSSHPSNMLLDMRRNTRYTLRHTLSVWDCARCPKQR